MLGRSIPSMALETLLKPWKILPPIQAAVDEMLIGVCSSGDLIEIRQIMRIGTARFNDKKGQEDRQEGPHHRALASHPRGCTSTKDKDWRINRQDVAMPDVECARNSDE